jgi:isoleucyl-tRNA synthetase
MKRVPFVLDCWHNAGASPYARFTSEERKKFVPADFLTEGMDQTRGWANTLLLEHVVFTGKAEAPYKAFLFQGLAQDAKGRKMSKSLGNFLEANVALEKCSADVFRFYALWKCSPVDPMSFDMRELSKRPYQVLGTLYHLHRFFMQNAEYDKFSPLTHTLAWAREQGVLVPADRWLLSRLQNTVVQYTARLESCEFNFACEELEKFVVDVLSREYVPMVRRDLWSDDPESLDRRLAVYATLWHALKTLVLLLNPVSPFVCEFLWQSVYRVLDSRLAKSVSLESWPLPVEDLRDEQLEHDLDLLLRVVALSYSARQAGGLKRRWPLREAVVAASVNQMKALKSLEDLFLELANVKSVGFLNELSGAESAAEEGRWKTASEGDLMVLLDSERDAGLLGEGVMRDLARRVQALRKDLGFSPTDMLEAVHLAGLDDETRSLLEPLLSVMASLVRTKKVTVYRDVDEVAGVAKEDWREFSFDDKRVYVAVK